MIDMDTPSIALVITERDRVLADQLKARLARQCGVQTISLPAPASELEYVSTFETAATAAADELMVADLRGVIIASSAAEALLGIEALEDLCAGFAAITTAPITGILRLYKSSVTQFGIKRPVLLSTFGWPLTLMIRSEFLREGVLIPHMARLATTEAGAACVPAADVGAFIRSNVVSQCDGVILVGEDVVIDGARTTLAGSLAVPLLCTLDLVAQEAERLLALPPPVRGSTLRVVRP